MRIHKNKKPRVPRKASTKRPSLRGPRIAANKKVRFKLTGGPYDGMRLWLTDGSTMPFRVGGMSGRYLNAQWSTQ